MLLLNNENDMGWAWNKGMKMTMGIYLTYQGFIETLDMDIAMFTASSTKFVCRKM